MRDEPGAVEVGRAGAHRADALQHRHLPAVPCSAASSRSSRRSSTRAVSLHRGIDPPAEQYPAVAAGDRAVRWSPAHSTAPDPGCSPFDTERIAMGPATPFASSEALAAMLGMIGVGVSVSSRAVEATSSRGPAGRRVRAAAPDRGAGHGRRRSAWLGAPRPRGRRRRGDVRLPAARRRGVPRRVDAVPGGAGRGSDGQRMLGAIAADTAALETAALLLDARVADRDVTARRRTHELAASGGRRDGPARHRQEKRSAASGPTRSAPTARSRTWWPICACTGCSCPTTAPRSPGPVEAGRACSSARRDRGAAPPVVAAAPSRLRRTHRRDPSSDERPPSGRSALAALPRTCVPRGDGRSTSPTAHAPSSGAPPASSARSKRHRVAPPGSTVPTAVAARGVIR